MLDKLSLGQNVNYVGIDGFLDDVLGNIWAVHFRYGCWFVFQLLVHAEEVLHFIEDVLGQLVDGFVAVVHWVTKWDCNYLFVHGTIVVHGDYANWIASYK